MKQSTTTLGEWIRALETLVKKKAITGLTVRPSPTWQTYHALGLTPQRAFAIVRREDMGIFGATLDVSGVRDEPSGRTGAPPFAEPTMAFDEWIAQLDALTKSITSIHLVLVPAQMWIIDHELGVAPQKTFRNLVRALCDLGIVLDVADLGEGVSDRPL